MTSDVTETPVGTTRRDSTEPAPSEPETAAAARASKKTFAASSTSGDDLTASLTQGRPDPLLGEFHSRTDAQSDLAGESRGVPPAEPDAPASRASEGEATRLDGMNLLARIAVNEDDVGTTPDAPGLTATSSDALASIGLRSSPNPDVDPSGRRTSRSKPSRRVDDEEADDESEPRGIAWGTLLLLSYASAVTIGLAWVLVTGRRARDDAAAADALASADAPTDPGRRAEKSRKVVPPQPIPFDHFADLGETVRLGQIEVTPLSINSGRVELERNFGGREKRPGGRNAVKLRLRLRNVSADTILAPLDEAFVRERVGAEPDSFIDAARGGPNITMFGLAVESEWSIVGQKFQELKPGEALETDVVSVPDAVAHLSPEMTWRVRLRTDINHTDDLGVRFRREDVKLGR